MIWTSAFGVLQNLSKMTISWEGKAITGIFFLILSMTGIRAHLLPQPDTDDCVFAAICDLIKGDLLIEDLGDPGAYHENAKVNLDKSIKYKNCSVPEILDKCKRRRKRCEADINIMARNIFGISMDLLQACPYMTWAYMLFGCKNYEDWPKEALTVIPQVCRNCLTRCYLVDEFETAVKDSGRNDFPEDWELTRTWSRTVKSAFQGVDKRQNNPFIYPWNNIALWTSVQVTEYKLSKQSDVHGNLANAIHCPVDHFLDVVQETITMINRPQLEHQWIYSILRFGCSPLGLLTKNKEKQLWMLPLDAGNPNQNGRLRESSCWQSGKDRFIIGLRSTLELIGSNVYVNWTFTCDSSIERSSGPTMCPISTAACSVQPVYALGNPSDILVDIRFGCCTIPKVVVECGRPSFEIKRIDTSCRPVNNALQNCSYTSHTGIIVNGSMDTARQTTTEANLLKRILEVLGRFDPTSYRDLFKWENIPNGTGRLVETINSFEVVPSSVKFSRHQVIIKCGIYSLYARNHIKQFSSLTGNPIQEYSELLQLGCTIVYSLIDSATICNNISDCIFNSGGEMKQCRNCTLSIQYGMSPPRSNDIFNADAWSTQFDNFLASYRTLGFSDSYEWINTPKIDQLATLRYSELYSEELIFSIPPRLKQPTINCGGWRLLAKNIVDTKTFLNTTSRMNRKSRKIVIQEVEQMLGCKPVQVWKERFNKTAKECIDLFLNNRIECDLFPEYGYELLPSVNESTQVSLQKLNILALMAKQLSPRFNIFDWENIANLRLVKPDVPSINITREKYTVNLQSNLVAVYPVVTCGGYTLTANFVKAIGCYPIEQIEPFLPVCKGCTLNPNWTSLPDMEIDKYYINCGPTVECTWTVMYGWTNSNPTDTIEVTIKKLNNLVLVASDIFYASARDSGGISIDWSTVANLDKPVFITVSHTGKYDRIVFTPTIKCGSISMYSNLHEYDLFVDTLGKING